MKGGEAGGVGGSTGGAGGSTGGAANADAEGSTGGAAGDIGSVYTSTSASTRRHGTAQAVWRMVSHAPLLSPPHETMYGLGSASAS